MQNLFSKKSCARFIGAHNALGARIGQRAGFDAIWASGLEISASLGVPDANIVSASEICRISANIAAATSLPVMVDMDSGYGEPQQVYYAVRDFVRAGVSAVCIEDKPFPKSNSFSQRVQTLQTVPSFVAKIQAAIAARPSDKFWVVARTEGFVVGEPPQAVVKRASAYVEAGANAIVVQSRRKDCRDIERFFGKWQSTVPVLIIPTSYVETTITQFQALGVRGVIYANQGMRASIRAMDKAYRQILRDGRSASIEDSLASIQEVFDLQEDRIIDQIQARKSARRRRQHA